MPDLISPAVALSITDRMGLAYSLIQTLAGDATFTDATTLNDAGVTDGATPTAGGTITLTSVPSGCPSRGVILIGSEYIRYSSRSGAVLTVLERGANGSIPAAHANASAVQLPATIINEASGIYADLLALGATYSTVLTDLLPLYSGPIALMDATDIARQAVSNLITYLDYLHVATRGPGVNPSIVDLGSYAAYENGLSAFSMLYSDGFNRMWWKAKGSGACLPNKTVFPPQTQLASGVMSAGPTLTPTYAGGVNRYSAVSKIAYTPGYAAQIVRARCTVAGSNSVILSLTGEGMAADMTYFGRASLGGESGTGADDDTSMHAWTGTLDLSAVGNAVTLTPTTAGDRILKAIALTRTGGTATSGSFVIETIPERNLHPVSF